MDSGHKRALDTLPKKVRDDAVRDFVLGRRGASRISRDLLEQRKFKITQVAVGRYMACITEEERLEIGAQAIQDQKIANAMANAEAIENFGEETEQDLKWVLRELRDLLAAAKGDDEKQIALGTLKEVRQSLMSLADLQGKLNRKIDIQLNLNESPQFIKLRQIILKVLEHHPAAKSDFLGEMKKLQVIEHKTLP